MAQEFRLACAQGRYSLVVAKVSAWTNRCPPLALMILLLGLFLPSVALSADTGYVFVSHEQSNTIAVLDPAQDHRIIENIPTSRRPRDMHFDASHGFLYVACGDDDVIDVIDVNALKVVDHIKTGRSPEIFALSRDGKSLYVSEEERAIVRQIDIASGETLSQIATGPEPEGVIVSRDGSRIYVTSEVTDLVHVVNTATGKVVKNILVGTRPRRFEITEDGREVWVSDELAGQVSVIDSVSLEVSATIPLLPPGFRPTDVTPVGLALAKEARTMYVTLGQANHVAFVDVASKNIDAYVLVGSRPWGVARSGDGKLLYVANGLSDDITIVDTERKKALRSIATGRVPHTVVVDD